MVLPNRSKYVDQQQLKLQVQFDHCRVGGVRMSCAVTPGADMPQNMGLLLLDHAQQDTSPTLQQEGPAAWQDHLDRQTHKVPGVL